ncbi:MULTISPECIES: CASTOR/POLLUX-related putative ion channel [Thermomonosporaceae]|uniref:CASTOR/POLLUX-related putative ion channel n=1 Tax=Thermomonosporaceae TaxID=2012 RepID=UPI00255AE823|nr:MULTISPECIES: potassium transporter TrkA [Thermomonosporaceae]MDL4776367.1 potassium transporter TrkA [Actinomadura xylanilytica]
MARVSRRERLRYWFDNTMAKGTPALIGWLALASGALILVVATLAVVITPHDADENGHWPGVVWRSLLRTLDPGTMGGDEGTAPFLGLMLTSTIGGIFIVSALIGVLTTGLEGKIAELRKGRSRIVERDHTVVLGWSDQVFTVIAELVEANQSERRSCVAILADHDKVDMEEVIRSRVGDTGRTRVVCRRGNPLKVADLELVSPGTARSVMVLSPPVEDADNHVIKVLLSLGARRWEGRRPHVVAAVHDSANLRAARLAGGPAAHVIDADDIAIQLIVQSHRQAGLSTVCTDLLNYEGHEFYMRPEPALTGRTYGESLSAYELGIPVGLRRADGTVAVNPPGDTVIRADDEMILLAEDDLIIKLAGSRRAPIVEEAITGAKPTRPEPGRTLLLGWNQRAPKIVRLLDEFVEPGSALTVAAQCADPCEALGGLANLKLDFTRCDPTDRTRLEALDVGSYQHVIVLGQAGHDPQHADARTLVTLLHLRDMEESLGDPYSIVSEINDDANREVAQVTKADDFVVSDKLISLMLTQLSENRHLYDVFADLLDPEGSEIYLKPAAAYLRPGATANFATVIAAAARRGETALGYRLRDRFHEPPDYGVVLNPGKAVPLSLTADDRVIVLAED